MAATVSRHHMPEIFKVPSLFFEFHPHLFSLFFRGLLYGVIKLLATGDSEDALKLVQHIVRDESCGAFPAVQLAAEARCYAREWADTLMAERLAALYRRQLEGRA